MHSDVCHTPGEVPVDGVAITAALGSRVTSL